jgi:hypothetical protein
MASLFEQLPIERAMPLLVGSAAKSDAYAEALLAWRSQPILMAGALLYVDDLEQSHELAQGIHSPIGSLWHAVMHRREGDFENSKYWYRQAGWHPLSNFDPAEFVDQVRRRSANDNVDLLSVQRDEWSAIWHAAIQQVEVGSK